MASFDPLDDQTLALAMHGELGSALDEAPTLRRRLAHLALIEKMLVRDGLAAVEALPAPALEQACVQMRSLPVTPREVALLQLREWLEQSLQQARRRDASAREGAAARVPIAPLPAIVPPAPRERRSSRFGSLDVQS